VYVFIVKGNEPFGAPVTPEVNAEALAKLSLGDKAHKGDPKAGYQDFVEVEGRKFAIAAKPCPSLGKDVALAMMVSEF
jgi:hypothetical protein